jgi:hypothetical protein
MRRDRLAPVPTQAAEAVMDANDYQLEASLYYAKSANSKQKALVFRRFSKAAEAIRFAVEELGPKLLDGCTLEVNEAHYFGREIRPLYDDNVFPLRRRRMSGEQEIANRSEKKPGAPRAEGNA